MVWGTLVSLVVLTATVLDHHPIPFCFRVTCLTPVIFMHLLFRLLFRLYSVGFSMVVTYSAVFDPVSTCPPGHVDSGKSTTTGVGSFSVPRFPILTSDHPCFYVPFFSAFASFPSQHLASSRLRFTHAKDPCTLYGCFSMAGTCYHLVQPTSFPIAVFFFPSVPNLSST